LPSGRVGEVAGFVAADIGISLVMPGQVKAKFICSATWPDLIGIDISDM
jgi:hypothetical protein